MLPSPAEFLVKAGLIKEVPAAGESVAAQAVSVVSKVTPKPEAVVRAYLSEEFKRLLVNYCASLTVAYELSEINWNGLSARLGTRVEHLKQAADQLDADGSFWQAVLAERIRRAGADKVFRDVSWESLEGMAQAKLIHLLERNLIKDTGELLAIASTARRSSASTPNGGGGTHLSVQINNGVGSIVADGELPSAGHKMTIDLSPRSAEALNKAKERKALPDGGRVIDSEMISAQELRELLVQKSESTQAPEGDKV